MPKSQQYKIEINTTIEIFEVSDYGTTRDKLHGASVQHQLTTSIPTMIPGALDQVNHQVLREIHDQMSSHERKNTIDSGFDVPDDAPDRDRLPPHLQHPDPAPEVLF